MITIFWNNRILDRGEEYDDPYERFIIAEVYYDNDNSPLGYVENTFLVAESIEGLREEIEFLEKACEKPVIPILDFYPDGST